MSGSGHGDTPAAAELQQALITQHAQGTQHGIGIDVQHRRQVPARGSRSPGPISPSAIARRMLAQTWSYSGKASPRSSLTSSIVLAMIAP